MKTRPQRPTQMSWASSAAASAAAVFLLSACGSVAPIAMTAPQGFEGQSESWAAGHRSAASGLFADESFGLGPYQVAEVRRDVLSSDTSFSLGPLSWGKTSTGFSYVLQGGDERLLGRCERKEGETRLPLWGNQIPLQASFGLKCDCQGQESHAELEMASASSWQIEDAWLPERIKLTINGQSFKASPFDHRGETMSDGRAFVGFRFDGSAGPAAAVGLFSPGQVWLHQTLPASQRAAMNCALAGLLLNTGP
ncbi:hypothetical protein LNV09_02740 [Paucibacter sp. B2R-40]|uniref:hypothetical protein n=1 Tax=Paucibacter sp. B2R-40 TaxID=2893554 RepID=UPI0021E501F1|nr:hypothetical protein [Paucibacter sp. B2R-40]MCV2353074.1 hypothetical protein [Paucibacter sp. B2R-40]